MSGDFSDAFVFFGASGALAYKQIFPALQALIKDGHLTIPVIGVAKSNWDLAKFKERAKDSLEKNGHFDQKAFEKLCSLLQYIDGDYADANTFTELKKVLGEAKRPIYYLAIPPDLFSTVAEGLAKASYINNASVVVEKPFGRDLQSAKKLNAILHKYFPEDHIFRIDHFLGKEPVQNLIYFRFANPIVNACWNHQYIESLQITMAERFGVSDRGKLYDEEGAIRDVVQNHILQVIACLTMECPESKHNKAMCDERGKLIESIKTLTAADIVRGQFRGYHDEKGVKENSKVETFAALRFFIDNDRWKNVPIYVRAGKCLPVTVTEALVNFKHSTHPVLDESEVEREGDYRFRLSPNEEIALSKKIKKPGEKMVGKQVELTFHASDVDVMPPYERLLGDAIKGDASLFAREDSVEAAWRVLDPILDNATPVFEYDKYTWGPEEAYAAITPKNGWHDPVPPPAAAPAGASEGASGSSSASSSSSSSSSASSATSTVCW
jgi:glucose-6-phosphate 1-dehydrogenase